MKRKKVFISSAPPEKKKSAKERLRELEIKKSRCSLLTPRTHNEHSMRSRMWSTAHKMERDYKDRKEQLLKEIKQEEAAERAAEQRRLEEEKKQKAFEKTPAGKSEKLGDQDPICLDTHEDHYEVAIYQSDEYYKQNAKSIEKETGLFVSNHNGYYDLYTRKDMRKQFPDNPKYMDRFELWAFKHKSKPQKPPNERRSWSELKLDLKWWIRDAIESEFMDKVFMVLIGFVLLMIPALIILSPFILLTIISCFM